MTLTHGISVTSRDTQNILRYLNLHENFSPEIVIDFSGIKDNVLHQKVLNFLTFAIKQEFG